MSIIFRTRRRRRHKYWAALSLERLGLEHGKLTVDVRGGVHLNLDDKGAGSTWLVRLIR